MGATPTVTDRLVMIRLLFNSAEEQSRLSPPFSADSINRLHDVVEMFLALLAGENHVAPPREFMKYWDVLEKPLGRRLGYGAQMTKLKEARRVLKHQGIWPADKQIREFVESARAFLFNECQLTLGVDLEQVSLRDLVSDARARALLASAEDNWKAGSQKESFADLSEAFDIIIDDYKGRKKTAFGTSVFDTTSYLPDPDPFHRNEDWERREFDRKIVESLRKLNSTLALVGLGVDLRRYGKFKSFVPRFQRYGNGSREVWESRDIQRTDLDYQFCVDFIVSTAIYLADFDYDFDLREEYRTAYEAKRNQQAEEDQEPA